MRMDMMLSPHGVCLLDGDVNGMDVVHGLCCMLDERVLRVLCLLIICCGIYLLLVVYLVFISLC